MRWHEDETEVKGGLTMANRHNGERTCVMIVEQDWDFGMKLADWLAAHGYQPVLVRSIDAAIDELSDIHPQAVFVGLQASKPNAQMNANEVLLMIQTICPLVPVITIADEASQGQTQVVFRQGGRSFLVKPVEFSQIGEVLKSAVSTATV
jgi:DNA-binding NtrC family response regulator